MTLSQVDQDALISIIQDDEKCITTLFKVVPKDSSSGIVPFILRPPQQKLSDAIKKYKRIIVLKPRQVGSTTFFTAVLFRRSMYIPYTVSVIVAHETAITERLLTRTEVFYDNLPPQLKPTLQGDSSKYKKFITGGTIFIGTAQSQVFGRGDTVHNLLASEVAFWKDEHIDRVLKPSIEGVPLTGTIILESTPNGDEGFFYEEIDKISKGESTWHLVIIYWWEEPDYFIEENDPLCEGRDYFQDFNYNPEEQALAKQNNLTKDQIRWRRFKIDSLGDMFYQEYIESLETCFLTSGMPYYDVGLTTPLSRKTMKPKTTWEGAQIWEEPEPYGMYIMGVDPGQARQTESVACVTRIDQGMVIDGRFTPVPKQVALLGGLIEPDHMGRRTMELAHYYNTCMIIPEANSHGIAYIDSIKNKYPRIYLRRDVENGKVSMRYGWMTTKRTKEFMMDEINRHLRECEIPDTETLRQIRAFRHDPDHEYFTNSFDDRHDAWGLSLVGMSNGIPGRRGAKGSSGFTSWDQ